LFFVGIGFDNDVSKKKKKKRSKSEMETENGDGTMLLADVQRNQSFVLASSNEPAKMRPGEWPLLLKVR
jgi:hypothetical protein